MRCGVMERRAHWTDDLIESVQRILDREWSRPEGPHEKAYDIIAAVEDWHRDRWTGVCESPEEVVRELKQAQAALQRVREACDTMIENSHRFEDAWDKDPAVAQVPYGQWMVATAILRALEGDSDE